MAGRRQLSSCRFSWTHCSSIVLTHVCRVVFRALQGIGGSGLFALAMAVVPEITPVAYMGHSSGAISAVSACSSVLGPIIGGVITSHSTWRWVFWLK